MPGSKKIKKYDRNLLLMPVMEIPAKEVWLYKNKKAQAMVEQGLRESAKGKIKKLVKSLYSGIMAQENGGLR